MQTPKPAIAFLIIILAASSLGQFHSLAAKKIIYIDVAAGSFDRQETVVTFTLPNTAKSNSLALSDDRGRLIPLEVDANGQATFVLPELKAGATKRFRLEKLKPSATRAAQGVELIHDRDRLTIKSAGRPVLGYQGQAGELPDGAIKPIFKRGGYIHPVYTPSGRMITDDYPPDHYHHHGIWFAWTKTEFEGRHPDFWNMGDSTGKVEFVALDREWSGPIQAGFKARHRYVDTSAPRPVTVLNEEWTVTVFDVGRGARPYTMFDLDVTHRCASASPLVLPEYRYGGVGYRGPREWLDKNNCTFLTSEGKDRANGNGTRARWCHIGGRVAGVMCGIAVLDHPNNFRAPQPTRLNPDQPFFCFAPSVMGVWEISPARPYESRYRFIVYDGEPDKAELDRFWNDYANPPQVTIVLK